MREQLFTKMVIDAWHAKLNNADTLLEQLTDEQLQNEVAPGRNRGIYILGHLTAVHDRMLPLLNLGEQLYPQLDESFITNPDKSDVPVYSVADLRQYWKTINAKLSNHFNNLTSEEWFQKHNAVTPEDFEKEPHRNRLNVLISRTNHLSSHVGQLIFLKNKN